MLQAKPTAKGHESGLVSEVRLPHAPHSLVFQLQPLSSPWGEEGQGPEGRWQRAARTSALLPGGSAARPCPLLLPFLATYNPTIVAALDIRISTEESGPASLSAPACS